MPPYETILQHAVPFSLVVFRLAGLFVFAPILSSTMVPGRMRVLLAVMLAAAMYPLLPAPPRPALNLSVFELLPMVLGETLIGAVVGIIASIPLISLELAGVMSGQQVGFGLARVYNPELETDADLFGQMLFYLGAGAFIAMNGVETMFKAVASTFARIPVGSVLAARAPSPATLAVGDVSSTSPGAIGPVGVPLNVFLGVLTSGFELGLRVAAPITGIVLLLVIAFAAIGKTMPQLNIMSVGFTIKILAALTIAAAAAHTISAAAGTEITHAFDRILAWSDGLASRSTPFTP